MNLYQWFRLNPYKKRASEVETPAAPEVPKYVSQFSSPASDERYKNYADYLDALAGPQDRTPTEDAQMADYAQHLDSMAKPGYGDLEPHPEQLKELPASSEGTFGVLASDRNPDAPKAEPNAFLSRFKMPETNLDFGKGTAATQENLRAAQQSRSNTELVNQLGKAAELIGTGLGRTKAVAQPLFDENIKRAGQPVQELEERIALEKKDPNSPYSQGFREYLKRFGVNVSGDFSGEQGEKMVPWALSQYNNELHRQTQKEINANSMEERKREFGLRQKALDQKAEEMKIAKDAVAEAKAKVQRDKRFDTMGKLLTSELGSSRSAFGKAANIHRSAEAIEQLISQMKDPNNLDSRQIQELAKSLDAMLSQGAGTITGAQKLVPRSAAGDVAKIAEYIANIPIGSRQGEFVKRTLETVQREKELAAQQIKKGQRKLLAPYSNLRDEDQDRWDLVLKEHDLPSHLFQVDEEGSSEAPVAKASPAGQMVKIRRKRDGMTKTLDAETAKKYLADPSKFEQVQ